MHSPNYLQAASPIAVVGASCRLPGAANLQQFWALLKNGVCAVTEIGDDRWRRERFWHPRAAEAGFSYTFAAGVIDDPFAFDPSVFGISPREAEQMDPQQRLLLELVWEALEDAGIAPAALSGKEVGVFVGASSLDYGSRQAMDPVSIDAHFMAGNTLSVIANRISYAFGLNGPSFTVDTACSSSLVALNQAMLTLESGRIDTAVVAGVNIIVSPVSFVGFSRAGMLSPTGLCRPFAANADGYVRAEGGVVLVLRRINAARAGGERLRAVIVASATNSDGRTGGLTLPSAAGQRSLMERLYRERDFHPDKLAFVEAHGTGTRVGDPTEADAIGRALGQPRARPLPIGSVKSNIGHLEPASGLAGVLKAMLALEHRHLPASLHLGELNPDIPFGELNLLPVREPIELTDDSGPLHAGVSSFGFGGTNAHVILRAPVAHELAAAGSPKRRRGPELLVISAAGRAALAELAGRYGEAIAEHGATPEIAAGAAYRRDWLTHRLALPVTGAAEMADRLARFARGEESHGIVTARATAKAAPVAFVYSGNGAQWVGMGRAAMAQNAAFRAQIAAIDERFRRRAGWSIAAMLVAPDLDEKLKLTSVAQPLLFAIQSAMTAVLGELGLRPNVVLGHSVGEIAAAEACGALSRVEAMELIHQRSQIQERAHGLGRMMTLKLSAAEAERLIGDGPFAGLEVAAINSPASVTLAGPERSITAAAAAARSRSIPARVLDLDYPFHSNLLSHLEAEFIASLGDFSARRGSPPFISTVTGGRLDGAKLDASYWWKNVREPVRFSQAVQAAADLGCRVFVEIGPHPILVNNIADTLAALPGVPVVAGFDSAEREDGPDPVLSLLGRAVIHGARVDRDRVFGPPRPHSPGLPGYPWQRSRFAVPASAEAIDTWGLAPRHPLIGARLAPNGSEWRATIDPAVVPYLADHKVDGDIVMPAAGFAEMALAAARDWLGEGPLLVEDFDIIQPLLFAADAMREIAVRLSGDTQVVEILSRPRLAAEWTLHARGRIGRPASGELPPPAPGGDAIIETDAGEVYRRAGMFALDYGPQFRRVIRTRRDGSTMEVELAPHPGGNGLFTREHALHPAALDAAFHGLFLICDAGEGRTYLPVRFGSLRLHAPGAAVTKAVIRIDGNTDRSLAVTVWLVAADGALVAVLDEARFQLVTLAKRNANVFFRTEPVRLSTHARLDVRSLVEDALADLPAKSAPAEEWLLLLAFARSLAHAAMLRVAGAGPFSIESAIERGTLAVPAASMATALLQTLGDAGLASEAADGWTLTEDCGLPAPEVILKTLIADHPRHSVEPLLAARLCSGLEEFLRSGRPIAFQAALVEQFDGESLFVAEGIRTLRKVVGSIAERLGARALRALVAEPGALPLVRVLLPLVRAGRIALTVVGMDGKRLDALEARVGRVAGLRLLDALDDRNALVSEPPFDLALGNGMPALFGHDRELARLVAGALGDTGALVAIQAPLNPVHDLLFGASEGWFARSLSPSSPAGQVLSRQDLLSMLGRAGFSGVALRAIAAPVPDMLLAVAGPRPSAVRAAPNGAPALVVTNMSASERRFASRLSQVLQSTGRNATEWRAVKRGQAVTGDVAIPAADREAWRRALQALRPNDAGIPDIVCLAGITVRGDATSALKARIASVAALLEGARAAQMKPRVWLVTRGAALGAPAQVVFDPAGSGFWAFGRVAINEYPEIDIRLVDLSPALDETEASARLAALIGSPGSESELLIDRQGMSAIRVSQGLPERTADAAPAEAARLHLAPAHTADRLEWRPAERVAPQEGEIEIEIAAIGLNFRDVMYSTGLLPDDILADGFAGAALGLECAGTVVRAGAKVSGLASGDRVMSFAGGAFATHVNVPAALALKVPAQTSLDAAAGIPVAFLTAWYGLIHLAKLKRNEWVLIHGAAGGVGLAALQVARWRDARIVATAGSEEKRALLRLLGADVVLDSRSLAFADEIKRSIGGVDVVLNSLSGAAMEASLKVLKPFGRFVELGKRDYVANSRLGLRPFRRNLTYHGVDLDQLLMHRAPLAGRLIAELARRFGDGSLVPLPHRVFEADDVHDAFLAMQRAAHVGKIVIHPPREMPRRRAEPQAFAARADGVHLVIGGTSGFGFETAQWLIRCGARKVVVASRRGRLSPEQESVATDLAARGIALIAAEVDVTRRDSVERLIGSIESEHGPLIGVVHAAMVLADGLMSSLDPRRMSRVLAPKVRGAGHLDHATRRCKLDYFVLFSSATTLIGNPGQAAYVAANGYLEGLARTRCAEGLPALAVAWGPITDAGALTRDASTGARLARRTGGAGLRASDALAHLGRLLARGASAEPVVACATVDWQSASRDLKVLKTPAFSRLVQDANDGAAATVDIAALLRGKSDVEARDEIAAMVARQVATILRVGVEDIDPRRPLSEIGMDSLMGLELKSTIEARFGLVLPLMALTSGKSIFDIVGHVMSQCRQAGEGETPPPAAPGAPPPDAVPTVVEQGGALLTNHGGDIEAEGLELVAEAVEERRKTVTRFAG